jgi:hypothetical protein
MKMKLASIISVSIILLLGACRKTSSWMMLQQRSSHQFQTKTTRTSFQFAPIAIISCQNIFNKEESDCPDEDECEIDWGAMPGFDDDDEGEKSDQEEEPSNELQPNNELILI